MLAWISQHRHGKQKFSLVVFFFKAFTACSPGEAGLFLCLARTQCDRCHMCCLALYSLFPLAPSLCPSVVIRLKASHACLLHLYACPWPVSTFTKMQIRCVPVFWQQVVWIARKMYSDWLTGPSRQSLRMHAFRAVMRHVIQALKFKTHQKSWWWGVYLIFATSGLNSSKEILIVLLLQRSLQIQCVLYSDESPISNRSSPKHTKDIRPHSMHE